MQAVRMSFLSVLRVGVLFWCLDLAEALSTSSRITHADTPANHDLLTCAGSDRSRDASSASTCDASRMPSRRSMIGHSFQAGILLAATASASPSLAFDGGVGGLGKTKPDTGVSFISGIAPTQDSKGLVSAEIVGPDARPLLVEFQSPWSLLPSTSGLETRDLRGVESVFVQLVSIDEAQKETWKSKSGFNAVLSKSVLASQGKFGAYGTPIDVKVKPMPQQSQSAPQDATEGWFNISFTSFTPGMLESDRQLRIRAKQVDSSLLLLIAGTTRARFSNQEATFDKVLNSLQVVPTPKTRLR